MPAQADNGIDAQHNGPVNHMGANMPKIGDEFRGFAEVGPAEPRAAAVFVDVNMKYADLSAQGDLHGLPDRMRAHHCADGVVGHVVGVGYGVELMRKNDPAGRLEGSNSAGQESDTLGGERVRSTQIVVDVAQQGASYFESRPHLRALRCCANISARRWLAGT